MPSYLAEGKDGFDKYTPENVKYVVDAENGFSIMDICKQFFKRMVVGYKADPAREARRKLRI